MKTLVLINDPPYGTERVYNALRLAHALLKRDPTTQLTVFLMADSVLAAKAQQKTPDGYYNIERMLKRVLSSKGPDYLAHALEGTTQKPNRERSKSVSVGISMGR